MSKWYTLTDRNLWHARGLHITQLEFTPRKLHDFNSLMVRMTDYDWSVYFELRYCNLNGHVPLKLMGELFSNIDKRGRGYLHAFTNARTAKMPEDLIFVGWCHDPIRFEGDPDER